ncbi:angiogenic factor with G patch and FHA domains 1 isoform X1 [Venturia canescens]|uniref:angiogenic factor with G patch and FHA domains 1 isoform X1 n=1 Tax=Venturia canescens TaxID=32260 RepID=UPI001C9CD5B3|nr:angiogenic factor with G patch and FHA domains 1 isoform X1 [Venturia canescens]
MTENCRLSESDEVDFEVEHGENDFSKELEKFPHVLSFIKKLQDQIKRQRRKIEKLGKKLLRSKKIEFSQPKNEFVDVEVQTECSTDTDSLSGPQNWGNSANNEGASIVEQVKEAAESALQQTGFVYEETSGLYYDYNSGYYYDAVQGLYYDGNTGTYYVYDEESKSYKFHSQAQVTPNETAVHQQKIKRSDKRKSQKANKDEAKKQKLTDCDDTGNDLPEEGECSDSDNSKSSRDTSLTNESESEDDQDLAKIYPPCMRIIVKETNLSKLKVGTLFLVAYTGGTLGREGDHAVLIPDLNISKHHARFQYDEDKRQYLIVDSGSRNGTILNGKRLSVAKQESDPCEVAHGSVVQLGSTKLLCHIHNGHETCGHCEPGLVQKTTFHEPSKTSKKDQHKTELRRLKNKFGVEKNNTETASQVATGYQDRAQARRDHVGSSNHHVKTQISSVETSIAKDNKGFKLLSKMGWSEGQSLGKDGDGRIEPVPLVNKQTKAGFGAPNSELSTLRVDPSVEKKQKLWRKTQKRYNELSD